MWICIITHTRCLNSQKAKLTTYVVNVYFSRPKPVSSRGKSQMITTINCVEMFIKTLQSEYSHIEMVTWSDIGKYRVLSIFKPTAGIEQ